MLALLLFLVLIDEIGFENQSNNAGEIATSKNKIKAANEIHLKFVDDMTIAEAVRLKQDLVTVPMVEGKCIRDAYR